jgi:hypothetical protein
VWLRMNKGEVLGWVYVESNPNWLEVEGERTERISVHVQPLGPPTGPLEYHGGAGGVYARLREACNSRGVNPMEAALERTNPEWAAVRRQLRDMAPPPGMGQMPGMGGMMMGAPPMPTSPFDKQLLCRLRYAGLGRYVLYDFQVFAPEEEDRLRSEAWSQALSSPTPRR